MGIGSRLIIGARASRHLALMVAAFATSVVATRLYLEMTGYPQIGNDTFHFAHALWGGLLQLIAALLLLTFVNRWIVSLSAIFAGVGIGLFVDEVGKFITQRNDYFFPLAAPIIYVVFLLTLLVYIIVRRLSTTDPRSEMAHIFQGLEELLESDLSASERDDMLLRLRKLTAQTERPDLAALAGYIETFLKSKEIALVPERRSFGNRTLDQFRALENRFISQTLAHRVLVAIYLLNGFSALLMLVVLVGGVSASQNVLTELLALLVIDESNITNATSLTWYLVMIGLNILTGLLLLAGLIAFALKRDRMAINLGAIALIITLTFTNTLSFYFHQFAILLSSVGLFIALLALQRYRDRFLRGDQSKPRSPSD